MEDSTPTPTPTPQPFYSFWKWNAAFERPSALETTWQSWLSSAQIEEQLADLRYWANRTATS